MGETFLGAILNNLMVIMPFVIIKTYESGVRWTLGRNARPLGPGFHWRLWVYHTIETSIITDEAMELPIQTIVTKDGKHVSFTVNIAYRIEDIVAHWEGVDDFEASTMALAMTHMAKRVRAFAYEELIANLDDIERSLTNTLTTRFKSWGTKVFSVGFTNIAETAPQVRVFVDIPRYFKIGHSKEH